MTAQTQEQLSHDRPPSRVEFLRELFGVDAPSQLVIWHRSDKRSKWIPARRLEDAGEIESDRDVYFGVALHDREKALQLSANDDLAYVRGSNGSAVALGGLAADFDVQGPAHKNKKLPRSFEEARAFIDRLPLPPTAIVNSGYGLQPWWFFKKLWIFDSDEERGKAQALMRRFNATIQVMAAEHGHSFDNISDLSRVLRLPETFNAKLADPVEVRIVLWRPDLRYDPSEIEEHLVEVQAIDNGQAQSVNTARVLAGVPAGERDSELFLLACKLRHVDVPQEITERLILEAAGKCSPPFPEKEARTKVASAYKYPPGASVTSVSSPPAPFRDFRELPALQPEAPDLPPELLPPALRYWLVDIAERLQVPLEFVAVPALIALSAIIGRTAGIHPKTLDDWLVVPNLWGGIVAPPGWLKSPAIAEALRLIKELATEEREDCERRLEENGPKLESLKVKETALKELLKQAHKGRGKGKTPEQLEDDVREVRREMKELERLMCERRYIVNDVTVEKLGVLLAENPKGLLLERDELAGWLRSLEREDRKGDREFFLESWNGTNSYRYDRITRGTIHVPALCLSLIGGIQPAKFKKYTSEALADGYAADGLLQRLQLLVWPEGTGSWALIDRLPDKKARQRASAIFKSLDQPEYEVPPDSEKKIPAFRFAPDAQKLFFDWLTQLEHRLRSPDAQAQPAFTSHLAKYRSLMPSLALLLHLVDLVDSGTKGPVTLRAAQMAADWCEFLEQHARKVYADELQTDLAAAHALAAKIRKGAVYDGMTVRDAYRPGWANLKTRKSVVLGAQILEQHGWVQVVTVETGGRSSQVLRITPALKEAAA